MEISEISPNNVLMIMAYTDDYGIGRLCEVVNRNYCQQYRYPFLSRVLPCEEMLDLIAPKLHFTWYKIYLFRQILRKLLDNNNCYQDGDSEVRTNIDYLLWIDSDAFILDFSQPLSSILSQGQYKNMIIAEDLHTCCLINAGVFFLRVNEWSYSFLEEVWNTEKYDKVFYYEQSALIKVLQRYKEGLERCRPFHSFVANGPQEVKLFPNVAVFPHFRLSSSHVITKEELEAYDQQAIKAGKQVSILQAASTSVPFICHAAGVKHKLQYLLAVIQKFAIPLPEDFSTTDIVFQLRRTGLGHYIPPVDQGNDYSEERKKKELAKQLSSAGSQEKVEDLGFDDLFQV